MINHLQSTVDGIVDELREHGEDARVAIETIIRPLPDIQSLYVIAMACKKLDQPGSICESDELARCLCPEWDEKLDSPALMVSTDISNNRTVMAMHGLQKCDIAFASAVVAWGEYYYENVASAVIDYCVACYENCDE